MKDRIRGYLIGAALGDALGRETEFMSIEEIRSLYGEGGIQRPAGEWTDDTQMIIAGAKALIEILENEKTEDLDEIASIISRHYIQWLDNPGHAPGNTCIRGVLNLKQGLHWSRSGVPNSKGCGSVMRSGIFGIVFEGEQLRQVASISGKMTHGHPTADAACIAGSLSIHYILKNKSPLQVHSRLIEETEGISGEFTWIMEKAKQTAESDLADYRGITSLGQGWIAEEAFAMSHFLFLRHPDDFEKATIAAANHSGDTDSVASITGGLIGARIGEKRLPREWIDLLDGSEMLYSLADRLAELL